ncbi:MAG: DsrH/TusB family sulfur metabolism protein [Gammaproteobacteria bacterium]|nr:DsrH/TusB family sulfur metabolism protein [Gammaproteobacteria bacterium]MDE0253102.1 DsrH/TusB family sulfur metabolism protein [Gammaproteobacteria bacterium]MDE0402950.1 DsrH/TusB family sulfur metabolism protein [Gammaproteobacteria bacterium]
MLHIVYSKTGLKLCSEIMNPTDCVLFVGNGVYEARELDCSNSYALASDVQGRGIEIPANIRLVSFEDWVDLIVNTSKSATWK